MARNMSFAMTVDQVLDQTKTVTRRNGWLSIQVGDELQPVEKGMGLKKGEKVKTIGGLIRINRVSREPIDRITHGDCVREGFPELSPRGFIEMYCDANKCKPSDFCNRIEFEYCGENSPNSILETTESADRNFVAQLKIEAIV